MQRNAEEGNFSSRSPFSSDEAVKEAPPTPDQRNSSAPQTTPQDSSRTPQRNTEEALGAFAEEMKELRKSIQFVREARAGFRPLSVSR